MSDVPPIDRRRALGLLGGLGLVALGACRPIESPDDEATDAVPAGPAGNLEQDVPEHPVEVGPGEIPEETRGPFSADGSNGPNILVRKGIVRRDITRSFAGPTDVAVGVPATLALTVMNRRGTQRTPYEGAAVYVWHCDAYGRFSLYDPVIANQNYLRGVQEIDAKGRVSFRTIYPAARAGRWPHIYLMVFESVEAATTGGRPLRTTQIALPGDVSQRVYRRTPYQQSLRNLALSKITADTVFGDGHEHQLAKVTGNADDGLRIALSFDV